MKLENNRRIIELVLSESFRSRVLEGVDTGSWKELVDQDPDKYRDIIEKAEALVRVLRFESER
ncbi:MAG TPA: hypothetical protein VD772_00260, partial [Anseongella sp.]|nr:hypothetical protein [Anseongella sp.]